MLPKLDIYEKTNLDFRRSINRLETHRLNNPDESEILKPIITHLKQANESLQNAIAVRKETV